MDDDDDKSRKRAWNDGDATITPQNRESSATPSSDVQPVRSAQRRDDEAHDPRRILPRIDTVGSQLRSHPGAMRAAEYTTALPRSDWAKTLSTSSHDLYDTSRIKRPRFDLAGTDTDAIASAGPSREHQGRHAHAQAQHEHAHTHHHMHHHETAKTANKADCCSLKCTGHGCSKIRSILEELSAELALLSSHVKRSLSQTTEPALPPPEIRDIETEEVLTWALSLVRLNIQNLQKSVTKNRLSELEQQTSNADIRTLPEPPGDMSNRQDFAHNQDDSRAYNPRQQNLPDMAILPPPPGLLEERRNRLGSVSDTSQTTQSSLYSSSIPNSSTYTANSPMQRASVLRMLPSPSSMNFPTNSILPPLSPSPSLPTNQASTQHLQDLQHQVSVKTLALSTLQREYDALLRKLERQRTQCSVLQRKSEVAEVEINAVVDEKEKLQLQVMSLEAQVAELQGIRDQARREVTDTGAQYMKIVEMSNRLHIKHAEEKKGWERERAELQEELRIVVERGHGEARTPEHLSAMTQQKHHGETHVDAQTPRKSHVPLPEDMDALRAEFERLLARTAALEQALHDISQENHAVQAAAQAIVDSASRSLEMKKSLLEGHEGRGGVT